MMEFPRRAALGAGVTMGYRMIVIAGNFNNLIPFAVHDNAAGNSTDAAISICCSEFAFGHVWVMLMLVLLLKNRYSTNSIVKMNVPAVNAKFHLA